jgi:2-oxoglutarate ferredoxin oxidoreductase subunit alpha
MNIENNRDNVNNLKSLGLKNIVIRFAGDSGDGMQLTGERLAKLSAIMGNDVLTLADYPAEIRAPAGSLGGVSGYQMTIGSTDVYTTGDKVDILVAMNPAALKVNIKLIKKGGIIIVNSSTFSKKNLMKAGYEENPLTNYSLSAYRLISIDVSKLARESLKNITLSTKEKERCKNFFALGMICWLLNRKVESTLEWIKKKFFKKQTIAEANQKALIAGLDYCESNEIFSTSFIVDKLNTNDLEKGTYAYINGNTATAWGLICAAQNSKRQLFLGSYPITPATNILQELTLYKQLNVTTYQAEDEIAGIGTSIGASFAGALAATSTSGPGIALKSEFINLAVMTELPLVIINVQRGGPSTGLPTKTEQSDLLQVLWGRNGESPLVVMAAKTPSDCFYSAYEAARIACKYMTPVILLTDGYLANGSESWQLPNVEKLPEIDSKENVKIDPSEFQPYKRFRKTLARPWVIPGTKSMEHCIGGLEKQDDGEVSGDGDNHHKMCNLRLQKIKNVALEIPFPDFYGKDKGDILLLSWGSSFGAVRQAAYNLIKKEFSVSHCHLKYLNPFFQHLDKIFNSFKIVLVVENNLGQLIIKVRAEFSLYTESFCEVRGKPIIVSDIEKKVINILRS